MKKLLTTAEAAAYLGYAGSSGIRNLVYRGELVPDGRRGKNGPYLYKVESLDAWAHRCLTESSDAGLGRVVARGLGEHDDGTEERTWNQETSGRRMVDQDLSDRPEDWEDTLPEDTASTRDNDAGGKTCTRETQSRDQGGTRTHAPSGDDYARRLQRAVARARRNAA